MPDSGTGRELDIVVYGATGFVGRQVLAYLSRHPDASRLRWGIAGRDRARLERLRAQTGGVIRTAAVLVAESTDPGSVDAAVGRTRIVLNTAGPFAVFGGPVVDACVRLGTHYVDITGETVWVRDLIDRYHDRAAAAGTRIIPCCGFDSVPSDLGSYLMATHIRRSLGVGCTAVKTYFQMLGGFNGGTVATYLHQHESGQATAGRDPWLLNPSVEGRPQRAEVDRDPTGVAYDRDIGAWVGPFIMGFINTRVVRRSAALSQQWQHAYGPDFHYQEYTRFDPPLARAKATLITDLTATFDRALARGFTRRLLKPLLPKPGAGPSERTMATGWFSAELLGFGAGGRRVVGWVRDQGDPGNRVTAKCVCEAALGLALNAESLPGGPERGGVLTPATGLGEVLANRLRAAGMVIEIPAA
jgi:short subunit dehydrogenase-like uncharacterized protein